jgi:hypothetical protein
MIERWPQRYARIAGVLYLGTIVTGALAAMSTGGRSIANLSATLCYVGVTVLFYYLFRPVNRGLSLVAAIFSLVGCLAGALTALELTLLPVSPLVFFGVYCLLIGYLILQSTFLPRILGVLMAIGGAGWLTFVSPALSTRLSPFNMLPGVVGEGALTLWLLVRGVDAPRWRMRATASERG